MLTTVGSRVWKLKLALDIHDCPPGLTPSSEGNSPSCTCKSTSFGGNVKCVYDPITKRYNRSLTKGFWMGVINSKLYVGACPDGYCSRSSDLPNSVPELNDAICKPMKRSGTLCGECTEGHGPAVNSWEFNCVPCNSSQVARHLIYYILLSYVPTFFIFLAIIFCDIRFTTGPAVSFVLYAQVISSVFDTTRHVFLNISPHALALEHAYYFIYGLFNLDFFSHLGYRFCISPLMNALDVIQLDYLEAFFPLLMILLVIVFVKIKDCFWNRFRQRFQWPHRHGVQRSYGRISLIHAFAAFLILSYTKFAVPSTRVLHKATLYDENGASVRDRIFLDGNYTTNQTQYYIWYSSIAYIVIIVFVALPPLFLLDKPVRWFNHYVATRVHCLRRVWPTDKVNIILDTFHGCYKPNMGFFAGLYFIFRLAIFATSAFVSPSLQFAIQQILCSIVIALLAIFQPYNNRCFNYVDILIFLNLAVINSLGSYGNSILASTNKTDLKIVFGIRYTLIYLPLIYMLAYIALYVIVNYRTKVQQSLIQSKNTLFRCCHKNKDNNYQSLPPDTETTEPIDSDSVLLQRAEENNTYRSVRPANLAVPINATESYGRNRSHTESNRRRNRQLAVRSTETELIMSHSMAQDS